MAEEKPGSYAKVSNDLSREIEAILSQKFYGDKNKRARYFVRKMFGDLHMMTYRVEKVANLKGKHLRVLFTFWMKGSLPENLVKERAVYIDKFCESIGKGKKGMSLSIFYAIRSKFNRVMENDDDKR